MEDSFWLINSNRSEVKRFLKNKVNNIVESDSYKSINKTQNIFNGKKLSHIRKFFKSIFRKFD